MLQKNVAIACAIFMSPSLAVASQPYDVCVRRCTAPEKALVLIWIPFHFLPRIKQQDEDFACKIETILTNRKNYQKPPNFFYALLNFNFEPAGHDFALFSRLKRTLLLTSFITLLGNRFSFCKSINCMQ